MKSVLDHAARLVLDGKFVEAIDNLDAIIRRHPLVAAALLQRGLCRWEKRQGDEALADLRAALRAGADSDASWAMALILLELGQFEQGWDLAESRWLAPSFRSPRLKTTLPLWQPGAGERVLVWSEQGLGDQILYAGLLQQIKGSVTAVVDVRLVELFQRSMPGIKFVDQGATLSNRDFDAQIPMMSLGRHFCRSSGDIEFNFPVGFLHADQARVRAPGNEFLIGLSWASTTPRLGKLKSVHLDQLQPILNLPNTKIISLQYGAPAQEIGDRNIEQPNIDLDSDLDGVAALIESCDCVVTVSNSIAHLAGALDKTTFMLNAEKLWYWRHRSFDASIFYPCVQIFDRAECWPVQDVVSEIVAYQLALEDFS